MNPFHFRFHDGDESKKLESFLVDRVYEFNARSTGYFDGRSIAGSLQSETCEIVAAFNGHTWGGCCVISHLWVSETHRSRGLGRALMKAAEEEAIERGCAQMMLATHSFQAPGFYERLGFRRIAVVEDYPKGYSDILYVKRLSSAASNR